VSDPSVIFGAIASHDVEQLASLLDAGSDPNAQKSAAPHWYPLHQAVNELEDGGPIEALVLLLRHGADIEGVDQVGLDTPLLMALYRTQPEAVHLLLAAGAETNVRGPEGDSPLRVAAERGDLATAALLLRCGARKTINEVGAPSFASALGIAAKRLDVAMIALLLRAGADPAARDGDHMTARDRLPPQTADNTKARDEAEALLGRSTPT
jgi:ankyrin repeat protein